MDFKPVEQLIVERTLSNGQKVKVGTLTQSRKGVFFQYESNYIDVYGNLSPFTLMPDIQLQKASAQPHKGLHGLFADSLPDGWGLLLQDRLFRRHGILPNLVTEMDRLALVGSHAMGALSYTPVSIYQHEPQEIDIASLGLQAQSLFNQALNQDYEGERENVLEALIAVGSSGGARPKAQIYMDAKVPGMCRTIPRAEDEAWLVKFTSANLALKHEEGLCEAVYLMLAEKAGLKVPEWQLLQAPEQSGATAWLAVKRFDHINNQVTNNQVNNTRINNYKNAGRYHMHSACGLLDADFRIPSLDYEDLIKVTRQLCHSPSAGQLQFKRAIFNLFAVNQDDHSKNWSFLQLDNGQWAPAPFYDATYSPHPFNEHATSYAGYGKQPPLKIMQKLATAAGYDSWNDAQHDIKNVVDTINEFATLAKDLGITATTSRLIAKDLDRKRQDNILLF